MSSTPNTHPDIYRSIITNGTESPGVVKITGLSRGPNVETTRAKGSTGATTTVHGDKISSFTATYTLADLDEVTEWETYIKILESSFKPTPKAISCYHPELVRQRVTEVIVEDIGQLQFDDTGLCTVAVKFTEYKPPRPKAAAKAKGTPERKGTTTLDPNAAAKRELELLLDQAKRL